MSNSKQTSSETSTIPDHLVLNKDDKDRLTDDLDKKIKIGKKKDLPVIKIPVKYIREIIGAAPLPSDPLETDNLVFFIGSYRDPVDLERYNTKVHIAYELNDIKHRPTLILALEKEQGIMETFFDVGTIKPPPEEESTDPLP